VFKNKPKAEMTAACQGPNVKQNPIRKAPRPPKEEFLSGNSNLPVQAGECFGRFLPKTPELETNSTQKLHPKSRFGVRR
jgi:hypothetical protein